MSMDNLIEQLNQAEHSDVWQVFLSSLVNTLYKNPEISRQSPIFLQHLAVEILNQNKTEHIAPTPAEFAAVLHHALTHFLEILDNQIDP